MKRHFLWFTPLVLLVIGIVTFTEQRTVLATLKAESFAIHEQEREMQRLQKENEKIVELRQRNNRIQLLQEQNKELYKLRNEIGTLRKNKSELEHLRQENAKLAAKSLQPAETVLSGYIPREQLRNAGFNTPEDAIQTFFWAMLYGERKDVNRVYGEEKVSEEEWAKFKTKEGPKFFKAFSGFAVVKKETLSETEVILHLQGTSSGAEITIPARRIGAEWKLQF